MIAQKGKRSQTIAKPNDENCATISKQTYVRIDPAILVAEDITIEYASISGNRWRPIAIVRS